MEVQEGLASPFQQKLGFTQMLRIFRVDTSNAYIHMYMFQFLRDKDPFLRYGHMWCNKYSHSHSCPFASALYFRVKMLSNIIKLKLPVVVQVQANLAA